MGSVLLCSAIKRVLLIIVLEIIGRSYQKIFCSRELYRLLNSRYAPHSGSVSSVQNVPFVRHEASSFPELGTSLISALTTIGIIYSAYERKMLIAVPAIA